MQTDHESSSSSLVVSGISVAGDTVRESYNRTLAKLKGVAQASLEFYAACVETGTLLRAKREEFRDSPGWLNWLKTEVEEISQPTASRLMDIAQMAADYSHGNNPSLPDRLNSVRALYDALRKTVETAREGGQTPPATSKTTSDKTKTDGIFIRLFRLFRDKPEKVTEPEKKAFVDNTAESIRICRENNWEIPDPIEIEA